MTKDISAMAFWKAAGPYSEGVLTDSPIHFVLAAHCVYIERSYNTALARRGCLRLALLRLI